MPDRLRPLHRHPLAAPFWAEHPSVHIEASAAWSADGALRLRYYLADRPAQGNANADTAGSLLRWPAAAPARHTDGLWQHTCCEAFVALDDGTRYREFNFSPSGAWAIYDFARYRVRGDTPEALPSPQLTQQRLPDGRHLLQADIPAALLPETPTLHLSLSAVLENLAGDTSYWALHHAAAQPDFHRRDSFCLTLHRP